MNLILVGGVFLGALLLGLDGPEAVKAPVETTTATPVHEPAQKPAQRAEVARKVVQAPASESQDRGWMTRELSVDLKTGETTEISVIGFAD